MVTQVNPEIWAPLKVAHTTGLAKSNFAMVMMTNKLEAMKNDPKMHHRNSTR